MTLEWSLGLSQKQSLATATPASHVTALPPDGPIYGHSGSKFSLNITGPLCEFHGQSHVLSAPWPALPLSVSVLGRTAKNLWGFYFQYPVSAALLGWPASSSDC